jgi:hypothetical protein
MNGYVTADILAERRNVTVRQVEMLCKERKFEGVSKFGATWAIPEDAENPHARVS